VIKVYCDTGGYKKELTSLEKEGVIEIVQFCYENRNSKIKSMARPSQPRFNEIKYTYAELDNLTYMDLNQKSDKNEQITNLIGKGNKLDIKHLDSAYISGCKAFLTSDKDDISSKGKEIYQLLGIRVFHYCLDWDSFEKFCRSKY